MLSDIDMAEVGQLTALRRISLARCSSITDAAMIHLSRLACLTSIDLTDTGVRHAGLVCLKDTPVAFILGLHSVLLDTQDSVTSQLTAARLASLPRNIQAALGRDPAARISVRSMLSL